VLLLLLYHHVFFPKEELHRGAHVQFLSLPHFINNKDEIVRNNYYIYNNLLDIPRAMRRKTRPLCYARASSAKGDVDTRFE
jgi:hypothetical protein